MRAAKVQASLRIRAVSPEPSLLAHTSSESRGTFRQEARSLAPLNGWACAVEICHDGMLEDTNSLDGAQFYPPFSISHSNVLHREICVKDFLGTTTPVILKFGTTVGYDMLYCVKENQPPAAYHSLYCICPFFFLSKQIFCYRFLSSYERQSLQILCTPWE